MFDYTSFSKSIKFYRKELGYSQEQLAEKIGISRQTLFNWENNSTSPDINQAKKISEIFKISLDDLLDIKTELKCSDNNSILSDLIGQECYLDSDTEDYRLCFNTLCKIVDISNEFIKIEFKYKVSPFFPTPALQNRE